MKRRGLLIALALVAVLAIAAAVGWALSRPPSAEEAAADYMRALSDGDYETIAAMIHPSLDAAGAAVADAFAGAAYGTAPEVEEITPSEGAAGVRASLELGGERHTVFFGMELRNGRWAVTSDYLALLDVSTTVGDSVWVGDALVPAGEVSLLPAVYPVSPAPREILTGGTEVAVSNDEPVSVAVDAALADDAGARAQEQLDAYLDDCTTAATAVPEACGIRIPWAADLATLEGVAYRIEQRPTVALSSEEMSFAATGGVLVATAVGTTRAGATGEYTYRADDWALHGTIRFTGDELVLAVR
ncbi:MAG TPA: hypothetical protein VFY91_05140 [Microbacterium sp.]|nr:hypothetical protein [Microbacterium sp.]